MKRRWITYSPQWLPSPMSYWVHRETDAATWREAREFDPPLPGPIPGRGFATFHVELDGVVLQFASLDELDECRAILSSRVLPTTNRLSAERGTGHGPNSHWLSRLPKQAKAWKYRQKLVAYLDESRSVFQAEIRS